MSVFKWNERPHQRMVNIKTPMGNTVAAVAMSFIRTGAVLKFSSYTFSDTSYYHTFIQSIVEHRTHYSTRQPASWRERCTLRVTVAT